MRKPEWRGIPACVLETSFSRYVAGCLLVQMLVLQDKGLSWQYGNTAGWRLAQLENRWLILQSWMHILCHLDVFHRDGKELSPYIRGVEMGSNELGSKVIQLSSSSFNDAQSLLLIASPCCWRQQLIILPSMYVTWLAKSSSQFISSGGCGSFNSIIRFLFSIKATVMSSRR